MSDQLTPTTEAGRRLLDADCGVGADEIVAIEQEAAHRQALSSFDAPTIEAIRAEAAAQTATAVEALRGLDRIRGHAKNCPAWGVMPEGGYPPCDCGYDDVWEKVRLVLYEGVAAAADAWLEVHDKAVAERALTRAASELSIVLSPNAVTAETKAIQAGVRWAVQALRNRARALNAGGQEG